MSVKLLLAVLIALTVVPAAAAQYPKTITLTVTKISRTEKPTQLCDNCARLTTVEAHTATANFVLTCEATMYPDHSENNTVCTQFETGVYLATMLSPEVISFWPKTVTRTPGANPILYSVRVEEARVKR